MNSRDPFFVVELNSMVEDPKELFDGNRIKPPCRCRVLCFHFVVPQNL